MSELDVTEAIEAVRDALYRGEGKDLPAGLAEVAVHVAAPIIKRAERDAIVARVEAEFIVGAVVPQWAQAGGKPTAAGIRRWVIGIVHGEAK